MKRTVALIVSICCILGITSVVLVRKALEETEPIHISLLTLIANREKYDGKLVRVEGVACFYFEGHGIHWSKEAFDHNFDDIALDDENVPEELRESWHELNGEYVTVEGVYEKDYEYTYSDLGGIMVTRCEKIKKYQ